MNEAHSWIRFLVWPMLCVVLLSGCGGRNSVEPDTELISLAASTDEPQSEPVESRQSLLKTVLAAIDSDDLAAADAAARKLLIADPGDLQALMLAAKIAENRDDFQGSLQLYREVIERLPTADSAPLDQLVASLVRSGRVYDAIEVLTAWIDRFPNSPQPRLDLAGLAVMVGVPETAIPSLRWLFQHNHGDMETLMLMANPARIEPDLEFCEQLLSRSGQDIRLRFAQARRDAIQLRWERVLEQLEPVVRRHPKFLHAQLLYGRALVESDQLAQLPTWIDTLPADVEELPGYWIVIGRWAETAGRPDVAAHAFLEVQRIDATSFPEHLAGLHRSLLELGLQNDARRVEQQIAWQIGFRDAFKIYLDRDSESQVSALAVANALVDLGRIWEGEAWARHAVALPNDRVDDLKSRYLSIRSKLQPSTPWILPEFNLAAVIRLSGDADAHSLIGSEHRRPQSPRSLRVKSRSPRFENEAVARGFIHTCELAPDAEEKGHWLHQSSGGGIGVIDFDLDSRPDVAAAMLDGRPLQRNSSPNRLFRNLGEEFVDVGESAGYNDSGFSQGITVGDINGDGFPDLFDANIGRNCLFINNGDGTFREVAQQVGLDDDSWSVSAAIADLDSDGNADLFVTNYCAGSRPFEQACFESGRYSACAPLLFEAAGDRVWKGVGNGKMMEMTSEWISPTTPGRGLGLVVGQIDQRDGLDVYVANDMTVNHLWSPEKRDGKFHMIDISSIRGVGVNGKSESQASMGIAFGDADDDGDFDLYLTHFAKEYHTYYEQVTPGYWSDKSYPSGLAQPTVPLLGFGTEWCDFDNDGAKELIVTNGHIDDFHQADVAYRMPGQVFRRTTQYRWEECERDDLGGYFQHDHIGRALAIADLDCDGRNDALITHLYEPVAMLMNRTPDPGRFIRFNLQSTRTHRDAIGAIVTVTIQGRRSVAMVTAGDGYMCSNQRTVSFGVGQAESVEEVSVRWPSGQTQAFGSLDSSNEYLLVEGSEAFRY
ncbi:ASPIC and UnbV [Stieleria maiorica]|uniref:ASPIC and UnbV n=1 Tax=Stieleria maiorica TaxID=2795974 RepID=A0A5B9MAZ3_9BACT|nr:FG-GAP-like repeat-containing protein [Stieleria maiorica]QEF97250.1 ASPIC and UnbV [Stieleria maiorica]